MQVRWIGGVIALALSTAACGDGQQTPSNSSQPVGETIEPWPFNVDEVTLSCDPPGSMAVFVTSPNGKRYAVNGAARSEAPLMRDIQAVVDVQPLIRRGLKLCRDGGRTLRLYATKVEPRPDAVAPKFTVEKADYGGGYDVNMESETVIDGRHPRLSLTCGDGKPFVFIDVIQGPEIPPPLRGVHASFRVDGDSPVRYEVSWGMDGQWTLRSGDERLADRRLIQAIAGGSEVVLQGPARYMPEGAIRWRLDGFGDRAGEVRGLCS